MTDTDRQALEIVHHNVAMVDIEGEEDADVLAIGATVAVEGPAA
jgi:hypothetical protein